MITTRTSSVCIVSDDCPADRTNGANHHTGEHAHDGTKVNPVLSEEGIETVVEKWNTKDDDEGIKVVNNVVGNTVGSKHDRESVTSASKTTIIDEEDWGEEKDTASLECLLSITDKLVVPWNCYWLTTGSDNRWFGRFPESSTADFRKTSTSKTHAKDSADIAQVTSTWCMEDQTRV